jgi:ethanolamine permease
VEKLMFEKMFNRLVNYENVSDRYLKQRQLKGNAGAILLWSLGVGAVISGNFFGWNFGLAAGGFWGLTIATVLMAIMYTCMVYCIAELAVMFPYAGGFYGFVRNAFGPFWGYICGLALAIEYVLTPAVIVVGIGNYLQPLIPFVPVYLIWLITYIIFAAINIRGTMPTLYVGLVVTLIAILVLVVFYLCIVVANIFTPELLFNVPYQGSKGIFASIPYAIWFYLAIEQLPLAAEETSNIKKNMPQALTLGMFALIVLSLLTLVLNTGVGGGAEVIGKSDAPLVVGFEAYFGEGSTSSAIATFWLLCGLIASFHTTIYAYGRVFFSLSRAGYLPRWISVTNKEYSPDRALILGAVIGYLCAVLIKISGEGTVGAALLNMAVFGAVISYALTMLSYIQLKINRPDLPRPYKSPLGLWGGVVGSGLALIAFVACLSVPNYRPAIFGVGLFLLAAIVYFLLHGRNHLVAQAPEERAALGDR